MSIDLGSLQLVVLTCQISVHDLEKMMSVCAVLSGSIALSFISVHAALFWGCKEFSFYLIK